MSDLTKILAEKQKEMLKLIAPAVEKPTIHQNVEDSDSKTENNHPTSTSTPIKSKETSKITPISCCNTLLILRHSINEKIFKFQSYGAFRSIRTYSGGNRIFVRKCICLFVLESALAFLYSKFKSAFGWSSRT